MSQPLGQNINHKTLIRAPRERVFEALTTADGWNAWFTKGSEIDPRVGGTLTLRWQDWGPDKITDQAVCPITVIDPPQRFAFKWRSFDKNVYTEVTFELSPHDEGTVIEVTEAGYLDTPKSLRAFMNCSAGWGEALTLLKFWLEQGVVY
ncbi:MAG TPA: SRPBCC domain-containing protein [candidate division Zixibacteria bacterium]|nr:SRPBCC domain-containing protein [candidate division Zixibacteria bacterium]